MIRLSNAQSWREVTGGRVTPSVFFRGIIERLKKKRRLKIAGKDCFTVEIPFSRGKKFVCSVSSSLFWLDATSHFCSADFWRKPLPINGNCWKLFKKAKSLFSKICFRKRTKICDKLMQIFRIYSTYLEHILPKCCVTPQLLSIRPSLPRPKLISVDFSHLRRPIARCKSCLGICLWKLQDMQ